LEQAPGPDVSHQHGRGLVLRDGLNAPGG
jgi:hypothetical protein